MSQLGLDVLLCCCGMPLSEVWHNWALTATPDTLGPGWPTPGQVSIAPAAVGTDTTRHSLTDTTDRPECRVRSYLNTKATPSINFIAICPTLFFSLMVCSWSGSAEFSDRWWWQLDAGCRCDTASLKVMKFFSHLQTGDQSQVVENEKLSRESVETKIFVGGNGTFSHFLRSSNS